MLNALKFYEIDPMTLGSDTEEEHEMHVNAEEM